MNAKPEKTALVTGATDGIGKETARRLLSAGLHVLMHGRSETKATRAANELARSIDGAKATPVWADLSKMRDVAALAGQAKAATPALDVLVNNAGVYSQRRKLTEDGFELTMAVNHFAPYLLTRLLQGLLSKSAAGRIVTVSSMAHQNGDIDIDDLTFERGFDSFSAYSASKLANILFTRELARRLSGSRITANCLHPGVIDTKLLHAGFAMKGAPVEQGARPSVYLATSEAVATISGKYFVDCHEATPSRKARDRRLAEALWRVSEELLASCL